MKVFKFFNHEKGKSNIFLIVFSIALMVFVFSILDIYIRKSFAFLLISIGFGVSTFIKIKKANKEFTEIIVDDDKILFSFLNKKKKTYSVKRSELLVENNEDTLIFYELSSNEFIGTAYKSKIIESEQWEILKKIVS